MARFGPCKLITFIHTPPPLPLTLEKNKSSLLKDLNSNPSLSGKIPSFPTNDPTNPIPNCVLDSNFHDSFSFINEFQNSKCHILASINIQSLHSKHLSLQSFLNDLSSTPINILALQETWSIPHPHLISIPGYNFTHSERKTGRGGGVGFYVKDEIVFKIIPELSLFIPKIFECLTIEVLLENKKSSFSSIYRSPSDSPEHLLTWYTCEMILGGPSRALMRMSGLGGALYLVCLSMFSLGGRHCTLGVVSITTLEYLD